MTFTDRDDDEATQVRREVLGDAHVDRAIANTTEWTGDFQALVTQFAWGGVWSRDGLDRPTRSLVTIAILAALGREDELRMHLAAAVERTGAKREELVETLLHVALYAGVPAANVGFTMLSEVVADLPTSDEDRPATQGQSPTGEQP